MKNIKSTNNTSNATTSNKALTAWAVEVNGEIDPRDIFPARMWARTMRNDYAAHFPSEDKVSVRKVMITPVKGR